jgi:hypothetical protein
MSFTNRYICQRVMRNVEVEQNEKRAVARFFSRIANLAREQYNGLSFTLFRVQKGT